MEFELNEWLEYAERVAKQFARTYWPKGDSWLDHWEDVYQELAFELITKEERLAKAFVNMEKPAGYTKVILKNAAWRACMAEKRKEKRESDFYEYQTADVKVMLEQFFGGKKEGIFVPEDAKSVHGDDDLAIFGDIARVIDGLPEADVNVLETYFYGSEAKDTAERQRYSRVVRKLTTTLNYNKKKATLEYEGTGSRKIVSNRTALGVSKDTYNMREKDFA